MRFIEYIEERIKDEAEFDVIVDGVDMPATLGFCDDWVITYYCKEKYEDLLNSEIDVYEYTHDIDTVEVLYDDYRVGEQFCWAVAGYIDETEWNRLFMNSQKGAIMTEKYIIKEEALGKVFDVWEYDDYDEAEIDLLEIKTDSPDRNVWIEKKVKQYP